MRHIWSIVLLVTLLSSCAKPVPSESDAGKKVEWNELALPGKTLSLIHPKKLQIVPFKKDFTAVATIGNDGADGAVAGPILFWGIRGDALIISKGPLLETVEEYRRLDPVDSDVIAMLTKPTLDGDVLTVSSVSGEQVRYRLIQPE